MDDELTVVQQLRVLDVVVGGGDDDVRVDVYGGDEPFVGTITWRFADADTLLTSVRSLVEWSRSHASLTYVERDGEGRMFDDSALLARALQP